jgi:transposase-like protein
VDAGQSVNAVAERLGVRPKTLSRRLERERPAKRRPTKRTPGKPAFLPVVLDAVAVKRGALELEVGDVRLRVEPGADVDYVAALVRALRAC